MPNKRWPRHGSMQFWPRKKAKRVYARVRSWIKGKEAKMLGFAGYKAGMADVVIVDNGKNSIMKGQEIIYPVTIIECPPMKIVSVRFYKKTPYGKQVATEVLSKLDKELGKKIRLQKKQTNTIDKIKPEEYSDITVIVHTQPKLTGIGKKKPEVFEVALGGSIQEKFNYAKENMGKEIKVNDVLQEGQMVDIHAITKGKGFQGPVKRFGVAIRAKKSEKTKRGPGSLGGWKGQGHIMPRVAHAGQMGYFTRTEYNKWILKIGTDVKEINPNGGFHRYGFVKNNYIIVKGSVPGTVNRIIRINHAMRDNTKGLEAPSIQKINIKK